MIGSLYLLLAADMEAEENESQEPETEAPQPDGRVDAQCQACARCHHHTDSDVITDKDSDSPRSSQSEMGQFSMELGRPATEPSVSSTMIRRATTNQSIKSVNTGGRRQVARLLNLASRQLAAKAHNHMEDSGFNAQEKMKFPEIPGEFLRNEKLPDIQKAYSNTPLPRSRATSFIGSVRSDSSNGEGSSRILQAPFRQLSLQVPPPARMTGHRPHSNTLPSRRSSFEYTIQQRGTITPRMTEEPGSSNMMPRSEQPANPSPNTAPSGFQIGINTTPCSQDTAPQIVVSSSKEDQEEQKGQRDLG